MSSITISLLSHSLSLCAESFLKGPSPSPSPSSPTPKPFKSCRKPFRDHSQKLSICHGSSDHETMETAPKPAGTAQRRRHLRDLDGSQDEGLRCRGRRRGQQAQDLEGRGLRAGVCGDRDDLRFGLAGPAHREAADRALPGGTPEEVEAGDHPGGGGARDGRP